MPAFVWLIPLFPLLASVVNGLFGRAVGRRAHWVAVPAILLSFLTACLLFLRVWNGETWTGDLFPWISAGPFTTAVTAQVDQLSAVMLLVVTGVGFLIHLYSAGYMHDDHGYARFFTYLNLFVFSMVMLVLAGNFLVLYVFWEAVGLCSYLLIGFWYEKKSASDAGKKAFIVNRVGDFGFGLGIMLIWTTFGTLNYGEVFAKADATVSAGTYLAIALLLFMGACGKSAQLPLYTWLPDAMEGPTPVSALIHAATMVTAGVYMVGRLYPLFAHAGATLTVIAATGALTALFAATIALVQWDLKRVLAYSTISQLGYMFVGMGVLAPDAGIFHLTTHAFFKALLFLAAGSVMHAMGGLIDMHRLGALARPLRWTAAGFVLGALALTGFPFFSGYFSKELILERAFAHGGGGPLLLIWVAGLATSFVTAVYITRAAMLTFAPPPSSEHRRGAHPHEAPPAMAWPMGILALLSVFGGALGARTAGAPLLRWLAAFFALEGHGGTASTALTLVTVAVGVLGIGLGYLAHRGRREARLGILGVFFERHWGLGPLYDEIIPGTARRIGRALADVVEVQVIDGAVNAVAGLAGRAGGAARRLQTGYVRQYAAVFLAGTILLLGYWLLR